MTVEAVKSHKAKSVLILREFDLCPSPTYVMSVDFKDVLKEASDKTWFIRGCPRTPQAGSSDFKSFKAKDLKEAIRYYRKLVSKHKGADVVVQPYVSSNVSGVYFYDPEDPQSSYYEVGFYTNGVTANKTPIIFRVTNCKLDWEELGEALNRASEIFEGPLAVEVVGASPLRVVQIRDAEVGTPIEKLWKGEFYGSIHQDPSSLEWKVVRADEDVDTIRKLGPNVGLIFLDASPVSHLVAAAIADKRNWVCCSEDDYEEVRSNIASLSQIRPGVVGTKSTKPVSISDPLSRPLSDEELWWLAFGVRMACEMRSLVPRFALAPLITWRSVFLDPSNQKIRNCAAFMAGVSIVLSVAAVVGETRYAPQKLADFAEISDCECGCLECDINACRDCENFFESHQIEYAEAHMVPTIIEFCLDHLPMYRDEVYEKVIDLFKNWHENASVIENLLKEAKVLFDKDGWDSSFGGPKWAECTAAVQSLYRLAKKLMNGRQVSRRELYSALDVVELVSHNGNKLLTKFFPAWAFNWSTGMAWLGREDCVSSNVAVLAEKYLNFG